MRIGWTPFSSARASCSSYAAVTSARVGVPSPGSWSVPTPQAILPPTAFASAAERRISSAAPAQSRPMPRCAVSMASATPRPCAHRWRRKASVDSQSTAAGSSGPMSAYGSATTCAAEKTVREVGAAAPGARSSGVARGV